MYSYELLRTPRLAWGFESKKIRKLLIYNNFRCVRETGLETPTQFCRG